MTWFKVDDQLAFHHKVLAAGNSAMGLWVRAGAAAAAQLTDGVIPVRLARAMGTAKDAQALVDAGLWVEVDGGYAFHDWQAYQPSREKVEADRAAAAERQRKARERARSRRGNGPPDPEPPNESRDRHTVTHDEVQPPSRSPRPDPTREVQNPSRSSLTKGAPPENRDGHIDGLRRAAKAAVPAARRARALDPLLRDLAARGWTPHDLERALNAYPQPDGKPEWLIAWMRRELTGPPPAPEPIRRAECSEHPGQHAATCPDCEASAVPPPADLRQWRTRKEPA